MESLAFGFESFYSQNMNIQTFSIPTSPSMHDLTSYELFLANIPKGGSKDNPWSFWMIELDKNFLNLLTYDEPPPGRNFQSCITNHALDPWVENPRNEDGSS